MSFTQAQLFAKVWNHDGKIFDKVAPKVCMYGGDSCRPAIWSHSLGQSNYLDPISEDGHAIQIVPTSRSYPPVFGPEAIGMRRLSTFYGFCQEHDSSIFDLIDRPIDTFNAEFAFLFAFRNAARELWYEQTALNFFKFSLKDDPSDEVKPAVFLSGRARVFWLQQVVNQSKICKDREEIFARLKQLYDKREYTSTKHILYYIPVEVPIVSAGIQHSADISAGAENLRLHDSMSFTLFSRDGFTYMMLSHLDGSGDTFDSLCNTANQVDTGMFMTNMIAGFETTVVRPSYWLSLGEEIRKEFIGLCRAKAMRTTDKLFHSPQLTIF
ncbi:MAG: motif [Patescibacteria group bacterium]|nr:motif [Patescibacteria group bacterium]